MTATQLAGPEIDAAVGRAIGLDVLGIAECQPDPDSGELYVGRWYSRPDLEMETRPIYLADACGCVGWDTHHRHKVFGHDRSCPGLAIVPLYSSDVGAAMTALDTLPWWEITRLPGRYLVAIDQLDGRPRAAILDESLPLGICRAILVAAGE